MLASETFRLFSTRCIFLSDKRVIACSHPCMKNINTTTCRSDKKLQKIYIWYWLVFYRGFLYRFLVFFFFGLIGFALVKVSFDFSFCGDFGLQF